MIAELVCQHADLVEELDGTAQVFSVTWHAGETVEQRMWLIDHQAAIVEELRRRGPNPPGDGRSRRRGHRALRHSVRAV